MAEHHMLTEDIDVVLRPGLTVRDASGEKIGSIRDDSFTAAYLAVDIGLVTHNELYVPYSAIASIDPREVYLNLGKDVLARQFSALPPATTGVESGSATLAVPDGYDGTPEVVNRVDLETMRRDLFSGMPVYDRNGEWIGTVDGIDELTGYLVAKRYRLSEQDFFIPFAAISGIDRQHETTYGLEVPHAVHLAISEDVLLKEYARMPDGVVLHVDFLGAPAVEQPG